LESAPIEQHNFTGNPQSYLQHIPSVKPRKYDDNPATCCAVLLVRIASGSEIPSKEGTHQKQTSRGYRAESEAYAVPTDETIFRIRRKRPETVAALIRKCRRTGSIVPLPGIPSREQGDDRGRVGSTCFLQHQRFPGSCD
jgi:hypothetical protein